ncbi:MAG: cytochrome P460 family protein [Nitrospira sp.]|nr:cytochrome P460 family protein [Nitrospira sp.]
MAVMMSAVSSIPRSSTAETLRSDAWLHVVVVRLLAVALTMTRRRPRRSDGIGKGLPKGYRAWPMLDSSTDPSEPGAFRRFYVCAKGAGTVDDEAFPVGTVLVVETYRAHGGEGSLATGTGALCGLESIFVLEKFASLQVCCDAHDEQGAWSYATYGADGRLPANGATVSGTGRVMALQSARGARCPPSFSR